MPTRWVIHEKRLDLVNTEPTMARLTELVEEDMKRLVPKDKHVLVRGIQTAFVRADRSRIVITRPGGGGGWGKDQAQYAEEVPYFVEYGTHRHHAQPFIRPAVYKKR